MKKKIMWAIKHVPSGMWDHGDSPLTLYPSEHETRIACGLGVFVPVKVIVTVVRQR